MRTVVQRVSQASVEVDGVTVGSIERGLLALVGVSDSDTEIDAEVSAHKMAGLRVFGDDQGRMNLSVRGVDGRILLVSQFTLYGDVRRGRRPSFTGAAKPSTAAPLIEHYVRTLEASGLSVECGRFGARMRVALVNDGPVTIVVETRRGSIV